MFFKYITLTPRDSSSIPGSPIEWVLPRPLDVFSPQELSFNYMVEYSLDLNVIFHSLADATRRDILRRVSRKELSVSTLAESYTMSLAGVAKHIDVLEKAKLIVKHRRGKEQRVCIVPKTVEKVQSHLKGYEELWEKRFETLDEVLKSKD